MSKNPDDGDRVEQSEVPHRPVELSATLPQRSTPAGEPALQRLGEHHRFTLIEKIAEGAMGVVMAAYDPSLDRKVAIKLLHRQLHDDDASEATTRLLREAQAMAQVSHPNVVTIHDVGLIEDQVFIAMEYVDGLTLKQWGEAESRDWRATLDIYTQAGRGLAAAHAAGLVHRDFKPDNVLVGNDGRVRVTDFGLVGSHEPRTSASIEDSLPLSVVLTRTGTLLGTPAYMAPEQHLGVEVDEQADQFAFCVALFEALYGERPFSGDTISELATRVLADDDVEVPHHSEVPGWVGSVVCRGLRRRPDRRHASMHDLLAALDFRTRLARRRRIAWTALAIVLIAALAATLAVANKSSTQPACARASGVLTGVWDATRKQEIGASFTATKASYADATWHTVSAGLDGYAGAIVAMRSQSCQATFVDHEQSQAMFDLRMACLDHRVARLRALTDVMREAEREVVNRAVDALAKLPPIADCGDRRYLEQRTQPPDDLATRARLDELDGDLAHVHSLLDLGRLEAAGELIGDLASRAEATAYAPVAARARLARGLYQSRTGDHAAAAATLEQAVMAAIAGRDERVGARIAAALVYITGYWLRSAPDAQRWSDLAAAMLTAVGGDPEIEAALADHRGVLAYIRGDYKESEELHARAVALFEHGFGNTDPRLTKALLNLSSAQDALGRTADARTTLARCHDLASARYGEEHPIMGSILTNQALLEMGEQRWAESLTILERALAIKEATMGPDNPRLASTLNNIGYVVSELGRLADSVAYYERALAIRSAAFGDSHPSLINTHINLALTLIDIGRFEEARHQSVRAEACALTQGDAAATLYPQALHGRALAKLGKRREALRLFERAYATREADGVDATELADLRFWMAQLMVDNRATRRRALSLAESAQLVNRGRDERQAQAAEVAAWLAAHR